MPRTPAAGGATVPAEALRGKSTAAAIRVWSGETADADDDAEAKAAAGGSMLPETVVEVVDPEEDEASSTGGAL